MHGEHKGEHEGGGSEHAAGQVLRNEGLRL